MQTSDATPVCKHGVQRGYDCGLCDLGNGFETNTPTQRPEQEREPNDSRGRRVWCSHCYNGTPHTKSEFCHPTDGTGLSSWDYWPPAPQQEGERERVAALHDLLKRAFPLVSVAPVEVDGEPIGKGAWLRDARAALAARPAQSAPAAQGDTSATLRITDPKQGVLHMNPNAPAAAPERECDWCGRTDGTHEPLAACDVYGPRRAPAPPVYGERKAHREICSLCHEVSRVGFHVPNDVWELAVHHSQRNSLMCLACFTRLADERGVRWDAGIRFFPVSRIAHDEACARPAQGAPATPDDEDECCPWPGTNRCCQYNRAPAAAPEEEDDEFDEDAAVMVCGHPGRSWSSVWRQCMECAATPQEGAERERVAAEIRRGWPTGMGKLAGSRMVANRILRVLRPGAGEP